MSTAVATAVTGLGRTWSLGQVKIQVLNVALVSGNTTVTVTGDRMNNAMFAILTGVTQTAAPTYSGNTATFTITDPAASVFAQAFILGV